MKIKKKFEKKNLKIIIKHVKNNEEVEEFLK